jgi:glycogen debranching enzyme
VSDGNRHDDPREPRKQLPRFTLKDGDTFVLADASGDMHGGSDGFFFNDTRVLSRLELTVADHCPSLLGGAISQDSTLFTAHLTNRPLPALGERSIPHGVIHIERSRFLWEACLYERLRLSNFSDQNALVPITVTFGADFADIFEVQGHVRPARGTILPEIVAPGRVHLAYRGRDGVMRCTEIRISSPTQSTASDQMSLLAELRPREMTEVFIEVGADENAPASRERHEKARRQSAASMQSRLERGASIGTSMRLFNQWLEKSRADLALLTSDLPTGPYPHAGIPWFATTFGRDAIITALQTLWIDPRLAAGVLRFLASTQATEDSSFRDSQPGKIMHEMRRGEMAALREVPFGKYYGGVDTTPLYVMLAGAYERHTGDRTLADEIWNALEMAIAWIKRRLDQSDTGFLDYARGEESGLVNQAWKDSHDSISHADGRLPRGPIAVVEVQAYAYSALMAMADLAEARNDPKRSASFRLRAERLRAAIEERFWLPEASFYALAIDGSGQPCRVQASNAGHLLFCKVSDKSRADAVSETLLSGRFASGWGIRTLAEGEARYNPMSYHNGSVWPHDTALCAAGIAHYGGRAQVGRIASDLFEAANHFSMRLPELFCGFCRVPGQGPTPYPVACLPQAWSSGCVFMLLQSLLGIRVDGALREVHIERPFLPFGVDSLAVRDLQVADVEIDLEFHRIGDQVVVVPAKHVPAGVRVQAHL